MSTTEVLDRLYDAFTNVTPSDMAHAFITTLPWIILGFLMNIVADKIKFWFNHREIRRRGEGYKIDVRKDSKRRKHESDDSTRGV